MKTKKSKGKKRKCKTYVCFRFTTCCETKKYFMKSTKLQVKNASWRGLRMVENCFQYILLDI